MDIMKAAYDNGSHVKMKNVGYQSISKLKIDFEESDIKWRRCCIDGQIVAAEEGGWMEVHVVEKGDEAVDMVVDG
jgi:hypothetical protein